MYYVTMTDRKDQIFGWRHARSKINKLVLECDIMEEAKIVVENAKCHREMKDINIRSTKPYYDQNRYETSYHSKSDSDYETWYEKNFYRFFRFSK